MTDTLIDMTTKVNQLNTLLETANNPKILWEEVKIVSDKAFTLQDELMKILDKMEATEKDLIKLQSVFDTREIVWDLMSKIATREMEIKEKTTKNRSHAHEKTHSKHTCGCGHSHGDTDGCGCHHDVDCGCGDDCECGSGSCKCGDKK